ncbi:ParB/RepB/Spo0J family partition protein [Oceanispirochaeta sp.]|uniref:ParB/RepB/Spo0J family partition protein n=1 Tax=Oceanispirochaeta sp. TaxID=2035350 RepID=UPI00261FA6BD|nr:ParB/RepB/Spo0J family partition protein [Oceanispirochaeta sp.]MDA3957437.1 ParB/RepB/Spo0J family partition protein [Oceanispirochaeta sp.]
MSKKKALGGMGLDALLSLDDSKQDNIDIHVDIRDSVEDLLIDSIRTNPDQPRKIFSEDSLQELANSIQSRGVIQPIIVEKSAQGYEIVAGERRYRASLLVGKKTIPAIVRDFTEEEKLEIALIENIQREDLTAIEEAKAFRNLMDSLDMSQQEVADKVGKKRSTVANSLRLLNLPADVQESLNLGVITAGHARAILAVLNPADQKIFHSRIRDEGLSVRESERMVEDLNQGKRPQSREKATLPKNKVPEILGIEQKFIDHFGTRVQVKGNLKKGKIEISYFSEDDLERIFDLIS